jgi:hypothetical protein
MRMLRLDHRRGKNVEHVGQGLVSERSRVSPAERC